MKPETDAIANAILNLYQMALMLTHRKQAVLF